MSKNEKSSDGNILELLLDASRGQEKKRREELLKPLGIREFFENGSIKVNNRTCQGLECELCIKACPTKALYWSGGKIGITKDLCVYCGACVVNCIVDDCITIERQRPDGKVERFSKPRDVILLCGTINARRRSNRTKSFLPNSEAYLKRLRKIKSNEL